MFTVTEQHLDILRRAEIRPADDGVTVETCLELLVPGWDDLTEQEKGRTKFSGEPRELRADVRTALEIVLSTGRLTPGRYRLDDPYGSRAWTLVDTDEQTVTGAAQAVRERQDELRDAQLLTAAGQVTAVREVIAYARTRERQMLDSRDAERPDRREARLRWEDRAHEIRCFADRLQAALDNAQVVDPVGLPHAPLITELASGEWGTYCWACSDAAQDYVPRCLVRPEGWPPLVLREATPSALIERRAEAAAETYGAP